MSTHAIRLRSSEELLAVVPYLLGFHPQHSLVVLTLHADRLGLTARVDLPAEPQSVRGAAVLAQSLLPSLLREKPDTAVLLGYENTAGDSIPVLECLSQALASHGVDLKDRLIIRDGRWRSLDCPDPGCCPPAGSPVPLPIDAPAVAAEFVGAGVSPHQTRAALAAVLKAGAQAHVVGRVLATPGAGDVPRSGPAVAALLARILGLTTPGCPLSVEDAAAAVGVLRDVQVRDALVAWLTPGSIDRNAFGPAAQEVLAGLPHPSPGEAFSDVDRDGSGEGNHVAANHHLVQDRLIRLCTMLPDEHAAPALTVLGCLTWWRGDGALTRVALDRALRCEPEYRLAQLLEHMVDLGIRTAPTT
ncbi:DUF4192 domain-containing protein [Dermatophilaceae bacterium Soc4.6]